MDTEDSLQLFDAQRISRQLDLILAVRLKTLLDAYTAENASDAESEWFRLSLTAFKSAVAELVSQNNRVLWRSLQELLENKHDGNNEQL